MELFSAAPCAGLSSVHTDLLLTVTENHKFAHSRRKIRPLRPVPGPESLWEALFQLPKQEQIMWVPSLGVHHELSVMLCSERHPPWLSSLTPSFPAPFHVRWWEHSTGVRIRMGYVPCSASSAWGGQQRSLVMLTSPHGT